MTGDASGDLSGTKLGNYRIDGVLGKGGMSVLYRATDVRLGRKVALKVIGAHLGADAEFRERFIDEARNTSATDHANIVPVYDFGELDGLLYIAMRLVDGSDLASRIGGAPMDPERALSLLEQVADALDTLHERGLAHLDIKPANVLVTGRGSAREHVYIADFGLTRRGSTGHRTTGGDFLGSPTYAAPEHLRGEPVDGRTDQYALACVAYTCLTGNPPFSGEVSAVIKGHLNGQPPPVSRAGLPAAVDVALGKGMAKASGERYATCTGFVSAVRTALRSASTLSESDAPALSAVTPTVRRPAPAPPGSGSHGAPRRPQWGPPPPPTPPPGTAPAPYFPPPRPGSSPGYVPPSGGGGGNRTAVLVGGTVAVAVVIATVLIIVLAGGGGGSRTTTPGSVRNSVPAGPAQPGENRTPPPSIPIEPGN